jgi:hypothetical protein
MQQAHRSVGILLRFLCLRITQGRVARRLSSLSLCETCGEDTASVISKGV